jgi:CRISPR-associated protein Cmr5
MAFLHEKGKKESQAHCGILEGQLRTWVHKRFNEVPAEFGGFMNALINSESRKFQMVTTECLAWLRWLRQIAPAIARER